MKKRCLRIIRRAIEHASILLIIAIPVIAMATYRTKFVSLGHFSNYRYTAEHQYGVGLHLWRDGPTIVGLISYAEGLMGDTPTGSLENVSFDPANGQLSFNARLTLGQTVDKDHKWVPSQHVFRFSGVITKESISGTLKIFDIFHPDNKPIQENIDLKKDDSYPMYCQVKVQCLSLMDDILKFRGPRLSLPTESKVTFNIDLPDNIPSGVLKLNEVQGWDVLMKVVGKERANLDTIYLNGNTQF